MARRHRGTLVCVVLKAKNLPNKRAIGKQDPYAELCVGNDTQCTQPDRRGGQHPLWDEQLHFEIYDAMQHMLAPDATPTTGHTLGLACYAHDKEPILIGTASLPLDHVLTHGEHDQWVALTKNERYAGEVYLELTFYSLDIPKYGNLGHGRPHAPPLHRTLSPQLPVGTAVRTTSTSHSRMLPPRRASHEVPRSLQVGTPSPVQTYTPPYAPQTLRHTSASTVTPERPPVPRPPHRSWTVDSPEYAHPAAHTPGPLEPPPRAEAVRAPLRAASDSRSPLVHMRSNSTPGLVAMSPRSPGTHGLSPIPSASLLPRSPSAPSAPWGPPHSPSAPWSMPRSPSAQWLQPLAVDESASSSNAPDLLSQWNTATDSSVDDASWASASYTHPVIPTTPADVAAAAAMARTLPHAAHVSAHEAIYGNSWSFDRGRPLPLPRTASGRRPLPQPGASGAATEARATPKSPGTADARATPTSPGMPWRPPPPPLHPQSTPPRMQRAASASQAGTSPSSPLLAPRAPRASTPGGMSPPARSSTPVRTVSPIGVSSPLASAVPITSPSALATVDPLPRTSTPVPDEPPPAYEPTLANALLSVSLSAAAPAAPPPGPPPLPPRRVPEAMQVPPPVPPK
ncbi:hypothetical protein MBRA1_003767 [Malassezia brasiliensis]|uniref:C2 domain-containing protein n=1 Tax=Malassezia brasiliensis TaxID=1821822 RepID=A0AAF0DWH6_9BASI|nr:hypothetical protein MBRA1_003767 [Malassezia brasiliensis]